MAASIPVPPIGDLQAHRAQQTLSAARTDGALNRTMTRYYVFNGDADGLCAQQQLRLRNSAGSILVTGVKRDIKLLSRVDASVGDDITVLDISFDQNRADVDRLLDAGASIRYFDHHYSGAVPDHPHFANHIDESPDICTSLLVDRHLGHRFHRWAIVAAFGDGLHQVARALAVAAGLEAATVATLEQLGTVLNYNAYGETTADLHFHPAELAERMLPFADPLEFARASDTFGRLSVGYEQDMRLARELEPVRRVRGATVLILPDERWSRRVAGVFAHEWSRTHPDSAIAVLCPKTGGGYLVSVRAPMRSAAGADDFCRAFETGGGRKRAAGINHLSDADVDRFVASFESRFKTP